MQRKLLAKQTGAFTIDALTAVFVVSLSAAAFYTLAPATDRAQRLSREDALATQLCGRFVEQLRLLKPADMNSSTLTQLNLIDSTIDGSAGLYSFTHIPLDEASKYSPAQLLKNGAGTLQIVQLSDNAKELRVTMTWTSAAGKARTIKSGTILGGYR